MNGALYVYTLLKILDIHCEYTCSYMKKWYLLPNITLSLHITSSTDRIILINVLNDFTPSNEWILIFLKLYDKFPNDWNKSQRKNT